MISLLNLPMEMQEVLPFSHISFGKVRQQKAIFVVMLILIGLMLISSVFSIIYNDVHFYTFLPIAFLGMLATNWSDYDKVKKEIKSRNLE